MVSVAPYLVGTLAVALLATLSAADMYEYKDISERSFDSSHQGLDDHQDVSQAEQGDQLEVRELLSRLERLLDSQTKDDPGSASVVNSYEQQLAQLDDASTSLDTKQHFAVYNDLGETESFDVDLANDKQIIEAVDGAAQGSMLVVDGSKNTISYFSPVTDECYLVGGIDSDVPSAEEVVEMDTLTYKTVTYTKTNNQPIRDPSTLADELSGVCAERQVFWLKKLDNPETRGLRAKRGWWNKAGESIKSGFQKIGDKIGSGFKKLGNKMSPKKRRSACTGSICVKN